MLARKKLPRDLAVGLGCITEEEWEGKDPVVLEVNLLFQLKKSKLQTMMACMRGKSGAEVLQVDTPASNYMKWGFVPVRSVLKYVRIPRISLTDWRRWR